MLYCYKQMMLRGYKPIPRNWCPYLHPHHIRPLFAFHAFDHRGTESLHRRGS
jgi:hypothetical protein